MNGSVPTSEVTHGVTSLRTDPATVPYDPITFSVLLSRFNSIATEMTLTLEYSAWTSILAIARDYSCAIYDSAPRQVCMFDAVPVHTMSMHLVIEEIAAAFAGDIHDGDVFLCNHPHRRNTHVGDLVTAAPVFVADRHMFWSVTRGHQLDTGAPVPSSINPHATDVWQEGFHIPPIKIRDRGRERADIIDLYLSNVRYADLLRGDLLAQLGSIEKGRLRLVELVEEYGVKVVETYVDAMVDYADRRTADEVRAMPDGEYRSEIWIDTDCAGRRDVPVKVAVTIKGDRIAVDYTGSGEQGASGMNGSFATSQAAPAIPFMYYISDDIPHNHGAFRHIEVHAPEGTICNARFPASTANATVVPSDAMHDVVNKAMAAVLPDRVVGGGARAANMPTLAGVDGRHGEPWAAMIFNNGGGFGAAKGVDGWPLLHTLAGMGGLKSMPIEDMELLLPLLVEQMEVETDSMGFGEWIGGPGIRFVVRPTHGDMSCILTGDGADNPPHGVLGGTPGIGGGHYVESVQGGPRRFYSSASSYMVRVGERRVGISTGGGGYGHPAKRDVEQVRRDARDELISRVVAEEVFGVVLDDKADPAVGRKATAERRKQLLARERPLVEPMAPRGSTWLEEYMGPDDIFVDDASST